MKGSHQHRILKVKMAGKVCLEQAEEQYRHKAMLPLLHVSNNTQFNLLLTKASFCLAVLAVLLFYKSL